jgi:glucokinase
MRTTKHRFWVGFDLGGTKMFAGVFDSRFRLIAAERKRTRTDESARSGVDRMIGLIHEALAAAKIGPRALGGIGIGTPGPLDLDKGTLIYAPNLGWRNVPLRKRLEAEFGCPVAVANDVDAGTYGEFVGGAARGSRSVLGVFPGTGIGGGFVYEGKLVRGRTQSCMEIGHMKVMPRGRLCGCGRRGCLETVASRLAIAADAAMAVYRGEAPVLAKIAGTDLAKIRSRSLAESIREGDKAVEDIVRRAASFIGLAVANSVNLLAPDLVVLGGGLIEAMPKLFLDEVRTAASDEVMDAFRGTFKVVTAELGDNAAITGAAALAAQAADAG